jgi:uncharacterized membrane protein
MSESTPPPSRRPATVLRGPSRAWRSRLAALGWVVTCAALAGLLYWAFQKYVLSAPDPTLKYTYKEVEYELLNPKLLGVMLVFPWFVGVLSKSLADLPWPQRVISVLLRCLFVAAVAFGLSRLARSATTEKTATVYLVDVSNSVPEEALADAQAIVARAVKEKPPEGVVKLITFAKRPRLVDVPGGGTEPAPEGAPDLAIARHGDPKASGNPSDEGAGSNLQAALQLAYGLYPPGYLKRAVILSDGAQTDGDILAEANRAKDHGVRVFTIPYARPPPGEVALQSVKLPDRVKVGETFEVKAQVYSTRATKARARLYQGEALNGLEGIKDVELKGGQNEVVFKSVVRYAGPVTYALELDQIADDKFPDNNKYAATIDVPGRPMVLYVEGTPEQGTYLANALRAQQFDVEPRSPAGFPASLKELERYDFVIVSDVAKEQLDLAAQDLIERYVRDLGGGFLFAGGESGYGLGGWYRTTIERILPVRMENEKKKEMPSVAMALVMDRSGSMTGLPIEMAKAAAKATVQTLSGDDLIEVIAFDSNPTRFVKLQPARNRTRISAEIARIQPAGGTEFAGALDAAFQDLTVAQARRKHVILLSDGRPNTTNGLKELVTAMTAESITLTTVGVGSEVDEQLMQTLADAGGTGRCHIVSDPNNLPKIFTKEAEMISRAAAVEEWFPVVQTSEPQFLKNVDVRGAGYLHGYVSTTLKPAPAEQILASDTDEPILARWRVGLGWSLAWTSDVKAKWAVDWIRWDGFEKFWGQLVREHMRQKHQRELDMKAEIVGGVLRASVDAFTPDERFENNLTSRLTITGPEPGGESKVVDLRQTAPGRYEAEMPMDKYGSFLLKAEHVREQPDGTSKVVAVSYGHVSNPYPREYASFEPDREALARVALATGGAIDPADVAQVFDPAGEKITYHEDLWRWFIYVAIVVFVLDLFVRRVRLFDRKFIAKTRRV